MIRLRRTVGYSLAVVCFAALPLAACGGGGGDDGGGKVDLSGVQITQQTPTAAAEVPEQEIQVSASGFSPDNVTVKAHTKVVWKWSDATSCAIQFAGKTGPEQTSGTYAWEFTESGSTFTYQCAGKPDKTGKVIVE